MMKKISILISVLILGVFLTACSKEQEQITIYSAAEDFRNQAFKAELEKQFPDLKVNLVQMSTGKLAARVISEGDKTEADIVFGLASSFAGLVKDSGILLPYEPKVTFKEQFVDKDGIVIPLTAWSGVFIVNTNELEKYGLPMPKGYKDLFNPIYKGRMAMPNPLTSSTGYFFVVGLLENYGTDNLAYLKAMKDNMKLFSDSGSGTTKMVLAGEVAMGLGMDFEAIKFMHERDYIQVVFPAEGSPYEFDAVMLVKKDKPVADHVLAVMDFLTGPDMYKDVYSRFMFIPVVEGMEIERAEYPAEMRFLNMDNLRNEEYKRKAVEIWESVK